MKKNDLIKLLESMPGNPEVMLWNGIVQDVVPIEKRIETVELTRDSKEYFVWLMKRDGASDDDVKKFLRKREWMLNEHMLAMADKKDKKKVYVLQARRTGKKDWDRYGSIEY
jgi:hypothetical protein